MVCFFFPFKEGQCHHGVMSWPEHELDLREVELHKVISLPLFQGHQSPVVWWKSRWLEMAEDAVDDIGVFNVWPSSKCSIEFALATFMDIEINCSHLPIPWGGGEGTWGVGSLFMLGVAILPNSPMGLRSGYPQPGLTHLPNNFNGFIWVWPMLQLVGARGERVRW